MKNLTKILSMGLSMMLIVFTLASCSNSAQRAINSGSFDQVIEKNILKLRKNKNKSKRIIELEDAFAKAQDRDLQRISHLKQEGNPANHKRIFDLYSNISRRQTKLSPLLPLFIKKESRHADFDIVNISKEHASYKNKAAEYMYAMAQKQMNSTNKLDARRAYEALEELRRFYPNYKDVNNMMSKARNLGKTNVLVKIINNTNMVMPKRFENDLLSLGVSDLDRLWADFHTKDDGREFDYLISFSLKNIDVSPESVRETVVRREKEIKDGWEYKLDSKGNVVKDSSGNDIKLDKYKMIYCDLVEVKLNKQAMAYGQLQFKDLTNGEMLYNAPISSEAIFDHCFATAQGNIDALNNDERKSLKSGPAPFPNDLELMQTAAFNLKPQVKNIINSNRDLVIY